MYEEMNQNEMAVDLFCELISHDAPSLHEGEIADWLRNWLQDELGLSLEEDDTASKISGESGNLICRIPGKLPGPGRLFSVHLDTVEPCRNKKVIIENGIIKTDGSTILGADDMAGVAAILTALWQIRKEGSPHTDIELLFTVAEELHLQGSRHIKPDWLKSDLAFVLDTSGAPGLAVNTAPGHIDFTFRITGKAAHAGIAPEQGISAVKTAAQAIASMVLGRPAPGVTANIGRIEGGTATNIVSEKCEFTAECRARSIDKLIAQADHMQFCVEKACQNSGAQLEVERRLSYLPFTTSEGSNVAALFRQACDHVGLQAGFAAGGGGSDLNHLTQLGIEGLVLAVGMKNVHSCNEQIEIDHLCQLTSLVKALMTCNNLS